MKRILIASTALALFAAPAQAQLLGGGGGLGGGLGGAVGGTLGGVGSIGSTGGGIDNVTRSTLEGTGSARGSARADRHSGRVDADGNGSGSLTGDLGSTLNGPTGSTGAKGRASGSGMVAAARPGAPMNALPPIEGPYALHKEQGEGRALRSCAHPRVTRARRGTPARRR